MHFYDFKLYERLSEHVEQYRGCTLASFYIFKIWVYYFYINKEGENMKDINSYNKSNKQLNAYSLAGIGIGGTIGSGFFLGSGIAITSVIKCLFLCLKPGRLLQCFKRKQKKIFI